MSDETITPEDEAAFDALPLYERLTFHAAFEFAEGLASLAGLRSDAADVHFVKALAYGKAAAVVRAVGA